MSRMSVVMPLFDAERNLELVIPPLERALNRDIVSEVIVVDDGSKDDGANQCRKRGFRVLTTGQRGAGPAVARNLGVSAAKTPYVLFVDSDVVAHDEAFERALEVLEADPEIVAVFGSYDDEPHAPGLLSRYRNLWHHYVHQTGPENASTFWAGLGAVRRDPYLAVGGFDAARFSKPSIEDIELAYRFRAKGGRIRLRKDMLGKHLKRWTLGSILRTDIFQRAIPWSRLIQSGGAAGDTLNVTKGEQVKALLAGLILLSLLVAPFWPWALVGTADFVCFAWLANRRFFALAYRRLGFLGFVVSFFALQLYYLYSAAAFVFVKLTKRR